MHIYIQHMCEQNDCNVTRDRKQELGLFYPYKVLTVPVKWYHDI